MERVPPQLTIDTTTLLILDIQERLMPAVYRPQQCITAAGKLVDAARILNVPIVYTEQYPKGLGPTCPELAIKLIGCPLFEKTNFSACVPTVIEYLPRPNVIVSGAEAHVCVRLTVLDLLRNGYQPWVDWRAVSSRRKSDRNNALRQMQYAGAIVTNLESIVFELLSDAEHPKFRDILNLVK